MSEGAKLLDEAALQHCSAAEKFCYSIYASARSRLTAQLEATRSDSIDNEDSIRSQ
jgi:hypothetical protein